VLARAPGGRRARCSLPPSFTIPERAARFPRTGLRRWPQFRDQPHGEQISRNGDLGHLEGDVAAMPDDLRADLDELLLESRQRPALDRLGRRQCPQEIAG
jgi:hypothetical protein